MAGRSQDKKGESSNRSKKSTIPSAENPRSSCQGSQSSRTSQSKASQDTTRKEKFPEMSSSIRPEAAAESKTSTARGPPDLLWITTDQPSEFKNPEIRHKISRHVMRDYLKDQTGKDSKGQRRKKTSHSSQSDEDPTVSFSTSQLPLMPSVDRSGRPANIRPIAEASSASRVNLTPALVQEMYYPLSVDLDSFEFRQRLGQLIYRHLSVWCQKQASRLCGNDNYHVWEEWIPEILENDSLLYAQAFAAVNHINFMNPKAYKPERLALKEHAIQKINQKCNDPDTAASDSNIGAVLCLASAVHLENQGAEEYMTHMGGLQKIVAMRGGLQGLHANLMLHDALLVCDILGMMIFRTDLALSADIRETSQLQESSFPSLLDSPLYSESTSSHPKYPELPAYTVQILDAMSELTDVFQKTGPNETLSSSSKRLCQCLESGSPGKDPTYEACRLAGLIYFRALYQNVNFASSENTELMQALRRSLETIFVDGWNGVPGVLLWALLIGTAAERTNTADAFLAGHLSITCLSLVTLGHDVTEILQRFLWLEKAVEGKAKRFSR